MRTLQINKNDCNQKLEKFLQKRFKTMPKSLMYMYIRKNCIKINGKKCDIKTILNHGDVLTFYIKDEFFEQAEVENYDFLNAPTNLDIVYEDENIIIVNKAPGIIVHPDKDNYRDSLITRIIHYLYKKNEYNPKEEKSFTPALVNRIDRNTGGIVVAAKNAESLRVLNAKIKSREIKKYYLCLVNGIPKDKSATLTAYITKNEEKNIVKIHNKEIENSKKIITKYKVLDTKNNISLLEIDLLTGRTHQIRAHLASVGYPLLGDVKYNKKKYRPDIFKHQALYSYKIKFSFTSDAGLLNYLNNKQFQINNVWFAKDNKINF